MAKPGVDFTPAIRDAVLDRDLHRCARCGRYLGAGANLHHRQLRSRGGKGTAANGITLCGSGTTGCHGWAHSHVAEATALGFLVPSWEDPELVPVLTWRGLAYLDDACTTPPRIVSRQGPEDG